MFNRFLVKAISILSLGLLPLAALEGKQFFASTELSFQEGVSLVEVRAQLEEVFDEDSDVFPLYDQLAALITREMGKEDQKKLGQAILLAVQAHQGKARQHSKQEPYICYPLTVTYSMMLKGQVRDPDVLIAAILHDSAPNRDPAVLQEIETFFGSRVAYLVEQLSAYPVSAKKQKQHELMVHAQSQSQEAAQVQLAALLYSLEELIKTPPSSWTQEEKDHYVEWAEAVIQRFPQSNLAMHQAVEESIQFYWEEQDKNR